MLKLNLIFLQLEKENVINKSIFTLDHLKDKRLKTTVDLKLNTYKHLKMSVFKKIFGREKPNKNSQIDQSRFDIVEKTDYKSLEELINQNAGLSFEKQVIFADVIGSNAWELDMEKGSISFGNLEFTIQIIGSLSFNNSSWMWGWTNQKHQGTNRRTF